MLNRRHIRIKVMQVLYALNQTEHQDLIKEEKFLAQSISQMYDLYLIMVDLLIEVHDHAKEYMEKSQQKMLATEEDRNPNRKFIENRVLIKLSENETFRARLEKRKLNNWRLDNEYVNIIFQELLDSEIYRDYMQVEESSFKEDRKFAVKFFGELVAPNEKLYDYLEDHRLTWLDDLPVINTTIVKRLEKLKPNSPEMTMLPKLYKDEDDERFAKNLLRRSVENQNMLNNEIEGNTPNWDQDRIAIIDKVLLRMALGELLLFPSIPVKVSINEYLELAKEYSTPKSSIFINGVLDRLSKKYRNEDRLNKAGRGLVE